MHGPRSRTGRDKRQQQQSDTPLQPTRKKIRKATRATPKRHLVTTSSPTLSSTERAAKFGTLAPSITSSTIIPIAKSHQRRFATHKGGQDNENVSPPVNSTDFSYTGPEQLGAGIIIPHNPEEGIPCTFIELPGTVNHPATVKPWSIMSFTDNLPKSITFEQMQNYTTNYLENGGRVLKLYPGHEPYIFECIQTQVQMRGINPDDLTLILPISAHEIKSGMYPHSHPTHPHFFTKQDKIQYIREHCPQYVPHRRGLFIHKVVQQMTSKLDGINIDNVLNLPIEHIYDDYPDNFDPREGGFNAATSVISPDGGDISKRNNDVITTSTGAELHQNPDGTTTIKMDKANFSRGDNNKQNKKNDKNNNKNGKYNQHDNNNNNNNKKQDSDSKTLKHTSPQDIDPMDYLATQELPDGHIFKRQNYHQAHPIHLPAGRYPADRLRDKVYQVTSHLGSESVDLIVINELEHVHQEHLANVYEIVLESFFQCELLVIDGKTRGYGLSSRLISTHYNHDHYVSPYKLTLIANFCAEMARLYKGLPTKDPYFHPNQLRMLMDICTGVVLPPKSVVDDMYGEFKQGFMQKYGKKKENNNDENDQSPTQTAAAAVGTDGGSSSTALDDVYARLKSNMEMQGFKIDPELEKKAPNAKDNQFMDAKMDKMSDFFGGALSAMSFPHEMDMNNHNQNDQHQPQFGGVLDPDHISIQLPQHKAKPGQEQRSAPLNLSLSSLFTGKFSKKEQTSSEMDGVVQDTKSQLTEQSSVPLDPNSLEYQQLTHQERLVKRQFESLDQQLGIVLEAKRLTMLANGSSAADRLKLEQKQQILVQNNMLLEEDYHSITTDTLNRLYSSESKYTLIDQPDGERGKYKDLLAAKRVLEMKGQGLSQDEIKKLEMAKAKLKKLLADQGAAGVSQLIQGENTEVSINVDEDPLAQPATIGGLDDEEGDKLKNELFKLKRDEEIDQLLRKELKKQLKRGPNGEPGSNTDDEHEGVDGNTGVTEADDAANALDSLYDQELFMVEDLYETGSSQDESNASETLTTPHDDSHHTLAKKASQTTTDTQHEHTKGKNAEGKTGAETKKGGKSLENDQTITETEQQTTTTLNGKKKLKPLTLQKIESLLNPEHKMSSQEEYHFDRILNQILDENEQTTDSEDHIEEIDSIDTKNQNDQTASSSDSTPTGNNSDSHVKPAPKSHSKSPNSLQLVTNFNNYKYYNPYAIITKDKLRSDMLELQLMQSLKRIMPNEDVKALVKGATQYFEKVQEEIKISAAKRLAIAKIDHFFEKSLQFKELYLQQEKLPFHQRQFRGNNFVKAAASGAGRDGNDQTQNDDNFDQNKQQFDQNGNPIDEFGQPIPLNAIASTAGWKMNNDDDQGDIPVDPTHVGKKGDKKFQKKRFSTHGTDQDNLNQVQQLMIKVRPKMVANWEQWKRGERKRQFQQEVSMALEREYANLFQNVLYKTIITNNPDFLDQLNGVSAPHDNTDSIQEQNDQGMKTIQLPKLKLGQLFKTETFAQLYNLVTKGKAAHNANIKPEAGGQTSSESIDENISETEKLKKMYDTLSKDQQEELQRIAMYIPVYTSTGILPLFPAKTIKKHHDLREDLIVTEMKRQVKVQTDYLNKHQTDQTKAQNDGSTAPPVPTSKLFDPDYQRIIKSSGLLTQDITWYNEDYVPLWMCNKRQSRLLLVEPEVNLSNYNFTTQRTHPIPTTKVQWKRYKQQQQGLEGLDGEEYGFEQNVTVTDNKLAQKGPLSDAEKLELYHLDTQNMTLMTPHQYSIQQGMLVSTMNTHDVTIDDKTIRLMDQPTVPPQMQQQLNEHLSHSLSFLRTVERSYPYQARDSLAKNLPPVMAVSTAQLLQMELPHIVTVPELENVLYHRLLPQLQGAVNILQAHQEFEQFAGQLAVAGQKTKNSAEACITAYNTPIVTITEQKLSQLNENLKIMEAISLQLLWVSLGLGFDSVGMQSGTLADVPTTYLHHILMRNTDQNAPNGQNFPSTMRDNYLKRALIPGHQTELVEYHINHVNQKDISNLEPMSRSEALQVLQASATTIIPLLKKKLQDLSTHLNNTPYSRQQSVALATSERLHLAQSKVREFHMIGAGDRVDSGQEASSNVNQDLLNTSPAYRHHVQELEIAMGLKDIHKMNPFIPAELALDPKYQIESRSENQLLLLQYDSIHQLSYTKAAQH